MLIGRIRNYIGTYCYYASREFCFNNRKSGSKKTPKMQQDPLKKRHTFMRSNIPENQKINWSFKIHFKYRFNERELLTLHWSLQYQYYVTI